MTPSMLSLTDKSGHHASNVEFPQHNYKCKTLTQIQGNTSS